MVAIIIYINNLYLARLKDIVRDLFASKPGELTRIFRIFGLYPITVSTALESIEMWLTSYYRKCRNGQSKKI